jgi:hypothetical protein
VHLIKVTFESFYRRFHSWNGADQDKFWAWKIGLLMGLPALLYLVADVMPYKFGVGRPNKTLERRRDR